MAAIEQLRSYYAAVLPFYDRSLEGRGDLPFWSAIAQRWSSRRILELGCGTGRVTSVISPFAEVTAVDLLIEMLLHAKQRAPDANFVVADLRTIAFRSAFDLVMLADDPMAHVTSARERSEILQRIAGHLTLEGHLVLEGLYRSPASRAHAFHRDVDGEEPFTIDESWEPAGGDALWNTTYRYRSGPQVASVTSVLRSWTGEEVARLPETGLQVEQLWADFDERPFTLTSPRIVIVARRRP